MLMAQCKHHFFLILIAVVHWKGILIHSGPKAKDRGMSRTDSTTTHPRSSSVDDSIDDLVGTSSSSDSSDSDSDGKKSRDYLNGFQVRILILRMMRRKKSR